MLFLIVLFCFTAAGDQSLCLGRMEWHEILKTDANRAGATMSIEIDVTEHRFKLLTARAAALPTGYPPKRAPMVPWKNAAKMIAVWKADVSKGAATAQENSHIRAN